MILVRENYLGWGVLAVSGGFCYEDIDDESPMGVVGRLTYAPLCTPMRALGVSGMFELYLEQAHVINVSSDEVGKCRSVALGGSGVGQDRRTDQSDEERRGATTRTTRPTGGATRLDIPCG